MLVSALLYPPLVLTRPRWLNSLASFAHLRKETSGHLSKTSGGRLVKGCPPTCECPGSPPSTLTVSAGSPFFTSMNDCTGAEACTWDGVLELDVEDPCPTPPGAVDPAYISTCQYQGTPPASRSCWGGKQFVDAELVVQDLTGTTPPWEPKTPPCRAYIDIRMWAGSGIHLFRYIRTGIESFTGVYYGTGAANVPSSISVS